MIKYKIDIMSRLTCEFYYPLLTNFAFDLYYYKYMLDYYLSVLLARLYLPFSSSHPNLTTSATNPLQLLSGLFWFLVFLRRPSIPDFRL